MAHRTPTIEVVVRDEVTRALERMRHNLRQTGGKELGGGFKGLENSIQSLARSIGREFGTLARMAGGGLLGAGFVAGINRTTQALANVARAAVQHRYLAEQIGLTNTQLSNLVGRGRALGMSADQTTAGITSLSNNLRELKVLGENASVYKSLSEAGGASGQRFAEQLMRAVRGPGGYDAAMRVFTQRMAGMNTDAQRKLSEIFGLGSIAFRDLNSLGLDDLPKAIELSEPAARALTRAMAESNIAFGNIKVTIGGALIPAFEQLARTLDQFLQGPGRRMLEQFADWVSKINIPWGSISAGLQGMGDTLVSLIQGVKKGIEDVDPIVQKIGGWEPVLLTLGALFVAGQHGKVTWALIAIGTALETIGKHDFVIKALADAVNATKGATAAGGGSGTSKFGSHYSKNIEDRRSLPPTSTPVSFQSGRSGYYIPGYSADDKDDADILREQIFGTRQQVAKLASFITGEDTELGDTAAGRAAAGGQIRTGPAPAPAPRGPTGPATPRAPATPAPAPATPAPAPATPAPATPAGPAGPTPPTTPPTAPAGPSTPPVPAGPAGPRPPDTPPSAPATGPTPSQQGGKGVMIFAHGIISRYGNTSVEQVEADARRLAKAKGYSDVVFVYGTPAQQTVRIRELVKQGGVGHITGFSGGAGPARKVGNETGIPTTTYGNTRVPGDATVPRVRHMGQTSALADAAERGAAGGQPQQPAAGRTPAGVTPLGVGGGTTPLPGNQGLNPAGVRTTAEQAGVVPLFPVGPDVNWRNMDAEYIARVNAVYRTMSEADKKTFKMTSGYRPATRAEAIRLGMDPRTSQESVWDRHTGRERPSVGPDGTVYNRPSAAARPGHSTHQLGTTADFANADALKGRVGFRGIRNDPPHVVLGTVDTVYLDREPRVTSGPAQPAAPSPIVWSNEEEIERLKREKELRDDFPLGGFTPIPGRKGKIPLKVSLRGPRGVKVTAEGGGAVGAATVDRSDPSGGIEGFSPA